MGRQPWPRRYLPHFWHRRLKELCRSRVPPLDIDNMLFVSERTIDAAVANGYFTENKFANLAEGLGMRTDQLFDALSISRQRTKSFKEFFRENRQEELFNSIFAISEEYGFYVDREHNRKGGWGTKAQWKAIYAASAETGVAVVDEDGVILGYWHFVLLDSEWYDRGLKGENITRKLTETAIISATTSGKFCAYLTDVVRLRENNADAVGLILLRSFVDTLTRLANDGIFLKRMYTSLVSNDSFGRAEAVNFELKFDHHEFTLDEQEGGPPVKTAEMLFDDPNTFIFREIRKNAESVQSLKNLYFPNLKSLER
jgi:hypothetical protein